MGGLLLLLFTAPGLEDQDCFFARMVERIGTQGWVLCTRVVSFLWQACYRGVCVWWVSGICSAWNMVIGLVPWLSPCCSLLTKSENDKMFRRSPCPFIIFDMSSHARGSPELK
jgi:hypothetical protein